MKVRLKKEIVTLGVHGVSGTNPGYYVKAEEWDDFIAGDDVILIDTRNKYEINLNRIFSQHVGSKIEARRTWLNNKIGSNRQPWIIKIELYNNPSVAKKISWSRAISGLTIRKKYKKSIPKETKNANKILGSKIIFIITKF